MTATELTGEDNTFGNTITPSTLQRNNKDIVIGNS